MVREISVQDLAAKQAAGERLLLLDVRQPEEHEIAALPGSLLVPMQELPRRWDEIRPPEGGEIIVYCHHGIRSRTAAKFLMQCGLRQVVSLAGGIDAWSRFIDPNMPRY
jgi:adenylyltransferase/sulfurtransferase